MRNLIILLAIIVIIVFIAPFGFGLGSAVGGANIQILPRWVEANNNGSGTAIAVYENNGEIGGQSYTPSHQPYEVPPMHPLTALVLISCLVTVVVCFGLFVRQIQPVYDNEWEYSSKEAQEWEKFYQENTNKNVRKYGPD